MKKNYSIREQIKVIRVQDGDNEDKFIIVTGDKLLDPTKYDTEEEANKQLEGVNWDIVVNFCALVLEMLNEQKK